MIGTLLTLIIYIVILGLLWWLMEYLLGLFPLPDPVPRIIRAVAVIVLVLIVIGLLLQLFGLAAGLNVPRLHFG